MNIVKRWIYRIDTSENTTRVLTLCAALATLSAFVYSNWKDDIDYANYVKYLVE